MARKRSIADYPEEFVELMEMFGEGRVPEPLRLPLNDAKALRVQLYRYMARIAEVKNAKEGDWDFEHKEWAAWMFKGFRNMVVSLQEIPETDPPEAWLGFRENRLRSALAKNLKGVVGRVRPGGWQEALGDKADGMMLRASDVRVSKKGEDEGGVISGLLKEVIEGVEREFEEEFDVPVLRAMVYKVWVQDGKFVEGRLDELGASGVEKLKPVYQLALGNGWFEQEGLSRVRDFILREYAGQALAEDSFEDLLKGDGAEPFREGMEGKEKVFRKEREGTEERFFREFERLREGKGKLGLERLEAALGRKEPEVVMNMLLDLVGDARGEEVFGLSEVDLAPFLDMAVQQRVLKPARRRFEERTNWGEAYEGVKGMFLGREEDVS